MALPIRIETRTGDTPVSKRQRQSRDPPDILLTTPEQLALLLASADAPYLFGSLKRVILDELHALVLSKRGDLLVARTGAAVSACARSHHNRTFGDGGGAGGACALSGAAACRFRTRARGPHRRGGRRSTERDHAGYARAAAVGRAFGAACAHRNLSAHRRAKNARSSSSIPEARRRRSFRQLWHINDDNLAIALHHGSLDVAQRRKVETAMAAGRLRAVVCTSSLDLGIDWGDVDLVINVGAPKGAFRLLQRIGRANHRMDEPSKGVLVPANRFEVMECRGGARCDRGECAGYAAVAHRCARRAGPACSRLRLRRAFSSQELYAEVTTAAPYAALTRADFDAVVDFVASGGYALRAYDRFARIREGKDGRWRIANPNVAQRYRLNVGTIVEADMLKVRLVRSRGARAIPRGGRLLGEVEEYFVETMVPGDTFVFSGQILKYEALVEDAVYVSRATSRGSESPGL